MYNNNFLEKIHRIWKGMIRRCYNINDLNYHRYGGKGIVVCNEWHDFKNFKNWYISNYRFDLADKGIILHLDKDLLSKNNKIYSPNTCIFLPKKINVFLANKQYNNKSGYTGVSWDKKSKKWRTTINDFDTHKKKHLGFFEDIEKANEVYEKQRRLEAEKAKNYLKNLGGYSLDVIEAIK